MAKVTKIDWSDSSWNPVTGCNNGCDYCYAAEMVKRFSGENKDHWCKIEGNELLSHICTATVNYRKQNDDRNIFELEERIYTKTKKGKLLANPYPYGFAPTFHRYRLDVPQKWKEPRNIFVCSMADLFDMRLPQKWVETVLEVCAAAPQHRYLFLTKNYNAYAAWYFERYGSGTGRIPKQQPANGVRMYFGMSAANNEQLRKANMSYNGADWISIEPMQEAIDTRLIYREGEYPRWKWVVIGSETKNGQPVNPPKREWVAEIVDVCKNVGVPVFLKGSLAEVWEEPLIQEYPWEVKS